ncbi:SDR family NAD(P)-dependent oxidoreductase [Phormidium pseudopriestleyi FRX01]|uniref:SDR family NAD(P)-dependent oxidoreductase n=1 Tax=Phormidium pseudopriestleyi FRX01 TaxID=1759528 RepID=A0ABS3FTC0_9CYAN|nr:SDR family NAD(P)-dependent oxidoreductase [Phormidium pseudopriestleyi]MBO0349617.1 SDR family NAD(P)-dependent oxidoreductase [Phormidium pseudopriestleyi FRX01]
MNQSQKAFIIGASQGIGLGFVKKCLENSSISTLFASYRHPESAAELLTLSRQHRDRLICLIMDITDEAQIQEATGQIQQHTDSLHFVINCVGLLHDSTLQPEKSLRQINPENLMRYFQVNSIGPALLAKHLLPLFQHNQRSIFATISAKVGSIGDNKIGGWYGYRASKAALNMLMRTVAIEYPRKGAKAIVITLHPGTTNTRLSKPFQRNVSPEKLFSIEKTVSQLWTVLENLEETDTGEFFSWDGTRLPW